MFLSAIQRVHTRPCTSQLDDESVFPQQFGAPFPPNFVVRSGVWLSIQEDCEVDGWGLHSWKFGHCWTLNEQQGKAWLTVAQQGVEGLAGIILCCTVTESAA